MRAEAWLIETILSLNPIEDAYKAVNFAKILFSNEKYSDQIKKIETIESDIHLGIPLKICYELYYTYKDYNLNHLIIHKKKNGTLLRIPIYDLRDSMRKLYFEIVEIIYTSGIMVSDYGIGESGNQNFGKEDDNL